jgi:hypothetical protein
MENNGEPLTNQYSSSNNGVRPMSIDQQATAQTYKAVGTSGGAVLNAGGLLTPTESTSSSLATGLDEKQQQPQQQGKICLIRLCYS